VYFKSTSCHDAHRTPAGFVDRGCSLEPVGEPDLHFYLRLNADEFPHVAHQSWLVSGAAYRGRYIESPAATRRRVRLYHPEDERQTVVLHADQLEPEVYPWASTPCVTN